MPAQPVPVEVPVKFKRVANIPSERLIRRFFFLRANRARLARACEDHMRMRLLGRELVVIEHELRRRGLA